ncbi:MAG: hypothetical protein N3D20_02815 [Candidatus Pacearchaeota archaeon]|nr:hypothetical protein [Candidatus Pacearchaeota archaeon]
MNNIYKSLELQIKDLNEWDEKDILSTIKTQYNYARQSLDFKKNLWKQLIKLYNNEFRKKFSDIQLGSKLLFTQFHETFASVDADIRRVVFKPRRPEDEEKVVYTNAVAKFDFEEMGLPMTNRELIWNTIFFGTGILDVSNFDTSKKVLVPSVQSVFTFLIDPKALDIESARFAGRFIYKTYYELSKMRNIDFEKVKSYVNNLSLQTNSYERVNYENQAKQILLGDNFTVEPIMPGHYIEILEWYFYNNGKLWRVYTDSTISFLLGFEKLDYSDAGGGKSKIPFVSYNFIKTSFSFWGLGLPELIEDNHRADVVLKNHLFSGIIMDSIPSYFVNYDILLNPKDLVTREINKIVWTKASPTGQIEPFPKTQVVSNDTLSFMNILQNEAVGAVGSSRILKGSLTQVRKTATEIAMAKAKQDLQISSIMRNIIDGEKDFWNRWLKRYQKFLKEDDVKFVELVGYMGAKKFQKVRKKDFIPETDPSVEVVSSLETESQKIIRRRELSEILPVIAQVGGNVKDVLRTILYDMDITPEQVDVFLSPSPHELRAKEENKLIENGELPDVDENDNDLEHIAIHYRAEDTKEKELHINAHFLNYLRKQKLEEPQKKNKKSINMLQIPSIEDIQKEAIEANAPSESVDVFANILNQRGNPTGR